jgi:hypothetical protein
MAKRGFKDGEIALCIASFVTEDEAVAAGTRRRVDELVKRTPLHWVSDGSTSDEIGQAVARLFTFEDVPEPPSPVVPTERRLRDEDALVHIETGERVKKGSKLARKELWVPVVSRPGLKRADALKVTKTLTVIGPGGEVERVVHAGQWIHKDDELVALHPVHMSLPDYVAPQRAAKEAN